MWFTCVGNLTLYFHFIALAMVSLGIIATSLLFVPAFFIIIFLNLRILDIS